MNLSLLVSLLSATSSIAPDLEKRGAVTVQLTRTIQDLVSVTSVVAGLESTVTNTNVKTTTTTTTRYTSTFTSTIFGLPFTYVSVFDSSVAPSSTDSEAVQPAPTSSSDSAPSSVSLVTSSSTSQAQASSSSSSSSVAAAAPASSSSPQTPSPTTTVTPSTQSAPATTAAPSTSSSSSSSILITDIDSIITDNGSVFPVSTDGYVLGGVLTSVVSGGICVVDYDYYNTDYTETVTSTSTLYSTTTL